MSKNTVVVDNKPKAENLAPVTKNRLIAEMKQWNEVERNLAREILGIRTRMSGGNRVSGKVKGTGKKIEVKVCKQMEILIGSLPKDKPVDIKEWAELAVKNGLQTQQPPERIVAYYKRNIIDLGFAVAIA
jgi:hypothetical protein